MHLRNGMNEVYRPQEGQDVDVVIVFIHGLFGHPFNTWAVSGKATRSKGDSLESQRTNGNGNASNVFWPRDLLPGVIPNALIYSWGYDADVQNFMSTASLNTIHQHSSNLLNDLADLRDEFCQESHLNIERSCPFIFVVHSLGGLIVKDALNISASMDETRDRRRSQVVTSTIGAVFLGTPHRGSKTASLGKTAFRVTEIFASQRPNTKLLQALERNSETLERITNSFYETLSKHKDLKIYSFREEKEVRRLGVFGMLVVPPDSARIGHANEDVGSIPEDHRHMAKYISSQDTGFVRVSKAIKRCVNDFKERTTIFAEDGSEDCLLSLNDPTARSRMNQVTKQYYDSLEWLYDSNIVPFSDWLADDGRSLGSIFWVAGKPGSGKSTLMKFALHDDRTQDYLSGSTKTPWELIGFFFHDRGSLVQKSMEGMLRELLFQLLTRFPDLFDSVFRHYQGLVEIQRTKVPEWDTETLYDALQSLLSFTPKQSQIGKTKNICLFIDALDEHGGDHNELLRVLNSLARVGVPATSCYFYLNIKILLASRPWPVFEKGLSWCPRFAINEHTRGDIEQYTLGRLSEAFQGLPLHTSVGVSTPASPTPPEILSLAEQITSKALGVFIWVRIVVDELCAGLRDGTPLFVLQHALSNMPEELKDLYGRALQKIDSAYVLECHLMIQIALYSFEPLPLKVFMNLLDVAIHQMAEANGEATENQLKSRLASRTGGLLEVVVDQRYGLPKSSAKVSGAKSSNDDSPTTVQFIHQTAREHALNGHLNLNYNSARECGYLGWGYTSLIPVRTTDDLMHSCLGRPERLLEMPGELLLLVLITSYSLCATPSGSSGSLPDGVVKHLYNYAHAVDRLIDSGAEVRLEDFNEAFDIFGDPAIAYFTNFNEEVMVKRGFEDSVRSNKKYLSIWCAISSGINNYYLRGLPEPNSYPNYLLFCALFGKRRNNCARVAKTVLNWGYPVDNIVGPTQFFRGSSGHWPYALESAYFTAFQTLIFQDEDGSEMSEETRLEVAEVLLEYGADLNATFDNFGGPLLYREFELKGRTPIEFCTRFRGPEWTALLLRHGAKLPVDTFTHRQLCSGLGTLGIFGIFVQIYRKALEELEKAGAPIENTEPSEPRTEAGFYSPVATSPDIRYLLASYGASLAAPWALPRTLLPLAKRKTWGVILSRTALGLSNSLKYNPNSQSPI